MGKIATWSEINSKVGTSGSPSNKCPTKSEILATGKVSISGNYLNNQLVQLEDITRKSKPTNLIRINYTRDGEIRWASDYSLESDITVEMNAINSRGEYYDATMTLMRGYDSGSDYISFEIDRLVIRRVSPTSDDFYNYSPTIAQ